MRVTRLVPDRSCEGKLCDTIESFSSDFNTSLRLLLLTLRSWGLFWRLLLLRLTLILNLSFIPYVLCLINKIISWSLKLCFIKSICSFMFVLSIYQFSLKTHLANGLGIYIGHHLVFTVPFSWIVTSVKFWLLIFFIMAWC